MASYLKLSTDQAVTVGPFVSTSGLALVTNLTPANERISLVIDSGSTTPPSLKIDNIAGDSNGTAVNQLQYIANCDAALMYLRLVATNVDVAGRAMLTVSDSTNHCPVFHEFTILPAQVYASVIAGTDLLDVNSSQIGGTAQTGRDLGASVLLSSGTGTGQIVLTAGLVSIPSTSKIDVETIKTQAVTCAAGVTVPATIASSTNITFAQGVILASTGSSAAIARSVWNAPTTGYGTAGSYGELVETNSTVSLALQAGVIVAPGGIQSTSFAAGAMDAAAFAANAIGASELAQDAAQKIADEILGRDLAGGASTSSRNVRNSLRALRNKVSVSTAGVLTVTEEDDSTPAWTANVTRTAGVDPLTSIDPA